MLPTKISIVIPAYNEAKYSGRCLKSIFKHGHKYLYEVIVVDNASSDDTSLVAKSFPAVRVIREEIKGLNRAREVGLKAATGDIVAYLDADTEMPEGWLETVAAEFSENPKLACLSGPYQYYDVRFADKILIFFYWTLIAFPVYLVIGYMAVGGNFAARRSALEGIGGFDTSISFYGDDTNIARRLHKVGKVKFKLSFCMKTSGRRLAAQGLFQTGFIYMLNFLSEIFLKRPFTKTHRDIR